ncbi:alkaline phosphatase family protein, partial [Actinocrinis sp.]|uniref:alkaline phosphatase family protein n=1 Tax=Actinocrinis sp. TaxID=1920516 RepID=UPI002CE0DC6C
MSRLRTAVVGAAALGSVIALSGSAFGQASSGHPAANPSWGNTTTPIKHLVVIYQENVSFDHYFGT